MGGAGGADSGDSVTSDFVIDGLGTNGDWSGFLWTLAATAGETTAGSSIYPSEILDNEVCVSGTLGASYEDWAEVGWNVNQPRDPDTGEGLLPLETTPTGTGVSYDLINLGGNELRLALHDTSGNQWCASLPPISGRFSGSIAYHEFFSDCWMSFDSPYAGEGFAHILVQSIAGSDTSETAFEYCVFNLFETP